MRLIGKLAKPGKTAPRWPQTGIFIRRQVSTIESIATTRSPADSLADVYDDLVQFRPSLQDSLTAKITPVIPKQIRQVVDYRSARAFLPLLQ
jgi:hypothetical protein